MTMRLNLTSQISLEQVEERLYNPQNEYEETMLTSYERLLTHIYPSDEQAGAELALRIAKDIKAHQDKGETYVLGISGGTSPLPVLREMIKLHESGKLSFEGVHIFPLYEFYPLLNNNEGVLAHLREEFLDKISISDSCVHSFDIRIDKDDIPSSWADYERALSDLGGFDLCLMGIGLRGTIATNAPGDVLSSSYHLVVLDDTSRNEAISSFNLSDNVPETAVSIGMNEIRAAKSIVLLAWGEAKKEILRQVVEEPQDDNIPASIFQTHPRACVYTDLEAADELARIHTPWRVTDPRWTDKLVRRALVWLCNQTGKTILNLTNQDYITHQLSDLLRQYGSAYDCNIKVFNDIQNTITGWPGGKPDADDSKRPERALPFPKRVIVFSPHPDDDVISMGGTFHRLVKHGHDVHVAYETSGNIAVNDEEVIRYIDFVHALYQNEGRGDDELCKKLLKTRRYLTEIKREGDNETDETRYLKGTIRRQEARTADRHVGLKDDHVHFLDLPFYETGAIKKKPLSEEDVLIVTDFIQSIKPHMIFVAGDLRDPHGTHRVATNAVLAALDELRDEAWLKDCRIWMYRGAWAEWNIDDIEMAVPMSPEELRFKRDSILKHQTQMDAAPFLGDDERLFWQRSEDRNRGTAKIYHDLGFARYEAIEAFVQYHPVD